MPDDTSALLTYRQDQFEKRADAADARMERVEEKLNAIQLGLAGLATRDTIRNWGLVVVATVIATGIGVGAILLQATGNQLSAFQAGLSVIQTVAAANQASPAAAPRAEPPEALPKAPAPQVAPSAPVQPK